MERQRGELVPIGEAIGNLSPVQALRDASPPAGVHLAMLSGQVAVRSISLRMAAEKGWQRSS